MAEQPRKGARLGSWQTRIVPLQKENITSPADRAVQTTCARCSLRKYGGVPAADFWCAEKIGTPDCPLTRVFRLNED